MKKLFLAFILLLPARSGFSQTQDIYITANYGVPHLYRNVVRIATKSDAFQSSFNGNLEVSKITGLNPIAFKAGYGFKHFEIGLSISSWNMKFSVTDHYNVQQAGGVLGRDETDTYHFKLQSTSFGLRPNLLVPVGKRNILFFGTALGFTNNKLGIDFSSTDAGKVFPNLKYSLSLPGTFYFAPSLGFRYFVSEFFGLNAEIGYEKGAILQLGLTARINTKK